MRYVIIALLLLLGCGPKPVEVIDVEFKDPPKPLTCGLQGDNDRCDSVADCCPLPEGSLETLVCVPASRQCCRMAKGPDGLTWLNCAALGL
jgi:hypothetical protein